MPEHQKFPWRMAGRAIYAVVHRTASDDDILIGMMDTVALAEEVVTCHNAFLDWVDPGPEEGHK